MNIYEYINSSEYINNFFKSEQILVKDLTNGINEVYLLENKNKNIHLILKKALPYFKQYGPDHPLNENRILFEAKALEIFKINNNKFVPNLYFVDKNESLILIEYIESKISLNQFLQSGIINRNFSEQLSTFLSNSFFQTSCFFMTLDKRKELLNDFLGNNSMQELSKQFIFTDLINKYTHRSESQEHLNELFTDFNSKNTLLVKNIKYFENKFLTQLDCLLHGDLKGGSILLNEDEISIIDYEFSNFGPMGYDLSSIIYVFVSLIVNYDLARCEKEYITWLISTIEEIWYKFKKKFSLLWEEENQNMDQEKDIYFDNLLKDTVGFMGVQMLCMMIPHVVPFKSNNINIENEKTYYKKMDLIAKIFITRYESFTSIEQVIKVIKSHLQYY